MNREAFKQLFEAALEKAAQIAEAEFQLNVPRNFVVTIPGWGYPEELIDVDSASELLYISNDALPFIVNVCIRAISPYVACAMVMQTGHPPVSSIDKTYNTPPGSGPFKQVIAFKIARLSDDDLKVGAKVSTAWS